MAHVGASKIVKPGGEKLDKLEEQVSHVSRSEHRRARGARYCTARGGAELRQLRQRRSDTPTNAHSAVAPRVKLGPTLAIASRLVQPRENSILFSSSSSSQMALNLVLVPFLCMRKFSSLRMHTHVYRLW